ncbi:hypothetical protein ABZ890_08230 [Streptomyces sp. NPDC046984]|uniref:hypothetical protein n=1 Tax=Streptomyces sp. NPDC046984 TaxID=3155138 RepID=UPI0033CB1574
MNVVDVVAEKIVAARARQEISVAACIAAAPHCCVAAAFPHHLAQALPLISTQHATPGDRYARNSRAVDHCS